jgi:hypothetical protein
LVRRWLIAIVAIGAVVRVGAAVYLGDEVVPVSGAYDQIFYHDLALNLLEGDGFVFTRPPWPFIKPGEPTAYYSFLYPMFLAGIYAAAGPHAVVARIVQALICALLPLQVFGLTRGILSQGAGRRAQEEGQEDAERPTGVPTQSVGTRETGRVWKPSLQGSSQGARGDGAALVAAGITAVYAYFVLYSASLQSEGIYLVLVAWALLLTVKLAEGPTWQRWLAWGLAVTLASLFRQVFMPIAAVLFLYIVFKAGRRVRVVHVALAGLVAAALILPFTVRNYRVFGQFLLLNSSAGQVFWNANHPDLGTDFIGDAMFPIPADLEDANEAELTKELMKRGWQLVADDPGRFVRLSLDRAAVILAFWPMKGSSTASNIARPLSWGICLPFMIAGLVLSAKEWRRWLLLYVFAAVYLFVHIISWVQYRYRMPVDLALIPFAGMAVEGAWRRAQGARRREQGARRREQGAGSKAQGAGRGWDHPLTPALSPSGRGSGRRTLTPALSQRERETDPRPSHLPFGARE